MAISALDDGQVNLICIFLTPWDTLRAALTSKGGVLGKSAESAATWLEHAKRVFKVEPASACQGPDGKEFPGRPDQAFAAWHAAALELGLRTADTPADCGSRVRIRGLRGAPELNGKEGTCTRWDVVKSRWVVSVGSVNEMKLVRPHNLEVLDGVDDLEPMPDRRWIAAWQKLRYKVALLSPEVVKTLSPRARSEDHAAFKRLGLQHVAPAVADLWNVFNGQDLPLVGGLAEQLGQPAMRETDPWSLGIFGGYSVYDHLVSVMLLSLNGACRLTEYLREKVDVIGSPQHANLIAFACSFNASKIFFVDAVKGSVYAFTRQPMRLFEQACPESPNATGLLRWFEEYVHRMDTGYYNMLPLIPQEASSRGISLFPQVAPALTCRVTRGVEVKGSCIYMPEHPQGWTYSITFALVGSAEERGFQTCQLKERHWEIQEGDDAPHDVRGDGVIGFFPILADGGWILNAESDPHGQYQQKHGLVPGPFRYQSCSGRNRSMRGSFGGDITFIPGTIRRPTGPPFTVDLEAFALEVPDFMY